MEDERTGNGETERPGLGGSDPSQQPLAPNDLGDGEPGVDVLAELAARGHEAVNRVLDDLATDPRLLEAIESLLAVKARLTEAARGARAGLDAGEGESVSELRQRVRELERRLSDLEGSGASATVDSPSSGSAGDDSR